MRLRITGRSWVLVALLGLVVLAGLYVVLLIPFGDAAKIQGAWGVMAIEDTGVSVNEPFLKTRQYVFDGYRAIVRDRGAPVAPWMGPLVDRYLRSPSFRLDPYATPKAIDLFLPDGSTMRGIYELDGDRLKICFRKPPGRADHVRPLRFADPATETPLVILERDRP